MKLKKKEVKDPRDERVKDILQLVTFEEQSKDLLSIAPLSPYDLYLRGILSNTHIRAAAVQTRDDDRSVEVQTDKITKASKVCQWPDDLGSNKAGVEGGSFKNVDYDKLHSFLSRTSLACEVLLEENLSDRSIGFTTEKERTSFGSGSLMVGPFHPGRSVLHASFADIQAHLLLLCYGPSQLPDTYLKDYTFFFLWDLNSVGDPQKVLACQGKVTCCALSNGLSNAAFCGSEEGDIFLWDLREPSSMHKTEDGDSLRYPTYSTSHVRETGAIGSHQSRIVRLVVLGGGKGIEIASLDDRGLLNIWMVVELSKGEAAGSEVDLGLGLNGRRKLVCTSSISLVDNGVLSIGPVTNDCTVSPVDPSKFFVTTTNGKIIQALRFNSSSKAMTYSPPQHYIGEARCIDVNPFLPNYFLCSFSEGPICIYKESLHEPLLSFFTEELRDKAESKSNRGERTADIIQARWSPSRPSVFYALDKNSNFYIWDLKDGDQRPIVSENLSSLYRVPAVTSFTLSTWSAKTRRPHIVFCLSDGSASVHTLGTKFSDPWEDEAKWLKEYLSCP